MNKFSVLISVYIKENPQFLKLSLESVINQTTQPNEIVIVKDGKLTLELDKMIDTFKKKYNDLINIIELEENVGLGEALREGVSKCKYDIIARMDSDDICVKNRFELQLQILEKDNGIEIVGSYIDEFEGDETNVISSRKVPLSREDIYKYAKSRNPFNHQTVMFRKAAILKVGNYKDFLWNEDYYLWVRMINSNLNMINIPKPLVLVRTGKDLFARRGGLKYAKVDFKLQKKFLEIKFINYMQFTKNCIIRIGVRIIPNSIRKQIYLKLLR
jgi:glycosyltransferase involved in cell wall biosynthesis